MSSACDNERENRSSRWPSAASVRRLHILLGSSSTLAPLWKAYHIVVQPGANGDVEHTLSLYVIDAQGHEREWVDGGYNPKALAADVEAMIHRGG